MRTKVFVDGSMDGRICISVENRGYTIQKIWNVYKISKVSQLESEIFAIVRALEILDPGDYFILYECKTAIDIKTKEQKMKKWMRHKKQRINRLIAKREDLNIEFKWVPRELNKAGLLLDGINPDINNYLIN